MSSIEITFENPWLLLLLIPSLAVVLIPYFRLPKMRRKTVKKLVPAILHSVIVLFLVLILSGFNLIKSSDDQAVVLVLDMSDSTEPLQDEMKAHAEEILKLMKRHSPIGIVAFGENQIYSVKADNFEKVEAKETNLEAALEYAATLLPSDRVGRILVLSDGKQTTGDAEKTARYLATRGIRIDAMYYDTVNLSGGEMQISSLTAPSGAYVGEELVFSAEVESNYDGEAALLLYDGEKQVEMLETEVTSGSNLIEIATAAETAGEHLYRLVLEADEDEVEENNECSVELSIQEQPSVLIIANMYSETFALEALLEQEYAVTSTMSSKAPPTIEELCEYDQVILSNVDYEDLPKGYDKLLQSYVSEHGRSLLVAGGGETLMYGHMEGTALEEMLPVTLSLSEETDAQSVALMLVLDCSSSMSRRSTYLAVAKQGAIKCVETMSSNDYIGVVSFNRVAVLNSPLIPASEENKASLSQLISRLGTNGGTFYNGALQKAHEELKKSSADIKHVLFLSDGAPSDRDFYSTVSDMASDGITVSSIGLGYTSGILSSLAESGGGRYYYVEDADDLPNIMLSETEKVVVSSLKRGEFTPVIREQSEYTEGLENESLPIIKGYLGTTLKEGATAYLTVDDGNPLYAEWTYGAGTVGCFTSDLKSNWTMEWFEDDVGQILIKNFTDVIIGDYLGVPQTELCKKEYHAFIESGEPLLLAICDASKGKLFAESADFASAKIEKMTLVLNPMVLLGILSGILMLIDIGIRKLRWKDICRKGMKKGTRS